MSKDLYPFNPAMGQEDTILNQDYQAGAIYFATDTRKIYLDAMDGKSKMPMGGNIGLFYGDMKLEIPPVDGQEEFEFSITDIIGNESGDKILCPNVDDLILNSDGCFYKVLTIDGEDSEIILNTKKLTIAGTGGGGSTDTPGSLATFSMSRLRADNGLATLFQKSLPISFVVRQTDELGDIASGIIGTYTLYINRIAKASGQIVGTSYTGNINDIPADVLLEEINTIDVGPYLPLGDSTVQITVESFDGRSSSKSVKVSTTNMVLTWNYDETTLNVRNSINTELELNWEISGDIEKTTHIVIDDNYANEIKVTGKNSKQSYRINYQEYNLIHGAHKIEMYVTALIGGGEARTPSIYKNIIVAEENNTNTIISVGLFEQELNQYTTKRIPIMIYNVNNTAGDATVMLLEQGEVKDTWTNVSNLTIKEWSYTPLISGDIVLTIQSGNTEQTFNIKVNAINIDLNEDKNYVFRFKASEMSSNNTIKEWFSNGIMARFSEDFDWRNGGLQSEQDENNESRKFLCIKAGSTMTIPYAFFQTDAKSKGKCIKIIFKATQCKDYDGQVLKCYDGNNGLIMRAQNATYYYAGKSISVPYCEDEYIEFELDITANSNAEGYKQRYIRPWLDGVPAGVTVYGANDDFTCNNDTYIEIGSPDCDVYLYMIKAYEKHLTDSEHLDNFIADAPNAVEMINRFERNDILTDEWNGNNEISYTKLAQKNPNCNVHIYEMKRMTRDKKDPIDNCVYDQYKGSNEPVLHAENVSVKVQGTSSAAYGLAAFNLDSNFEQGFTDTINNEHIDKWSMSDTAIPVNYFCTKVNVASAEGTNNAVNQEWYNKFQPYKTIVRGKKQGKYNTARDCMEFTPGVVFIKDKNPQTKDTEYGGKGDNVFKDTLGYCATTNEDGTELTSAWPKMYAIGCMGNSKDNIEVFHDTENPFECCIENGDNQLPGQWMVDVQGGYTVNKIFYPVSISSIAEDEQTLCPDGQYRSNRVLWENAMDEIYGFRYPDGIEDVKKRDPKYAELMIKGWYDFVYWMAHSNPQEAYERIFFIENTYYPVKIESEEAFENELKDKYIINDAGDYEKAKEYEEGKDYYIILTPEEGFLRRPYDIYMWNDSSHTSYRLVATDEEFNEQHADTTVKDETNAYFKKTAHVFGATNQKLETPITFSVEQLTLHGYKVPDIIEGETLNLSQYQQDYEPVLANTQFASYANTYTHDTMQYRIAKMITECEQHLCMDSVVYHYLFIERHSMVDNVAKNTFWSTEDGKVWNLTKNYDNDTSDGNDNQGKLTLSYGFEPGDKDDKGVSIFNAGNSVWLAFIGGLYEACEKMYNHLDNKGAWSPTEYLKLHKKWQRAIPERCWIEDYYRKYIRPYEVYDSQMFLDMHEGGQKTHQRTQYETYQNYYISSKYFGSTCRSNNFVLRAEGADITDVELPVSLYADCYIRGAYGSGTDNPNLGMRCKRNTEIIIKSPIENATDATIYLWPSNLYQQFGDSANGLNNYLLTQFESNNANKLRIISLGTLSGPENTTLTKIGFSGNTNLEEVYVAKYANVETLNLSESTGLLVLDARSSGFKDITLPDNAPTMAIQLNKPVTLIMSNLSKVNIFTIQNYNMLQNLQVDNVDNSEGINSQNIIDQASNLLRYKLKNVQWNIASPEQLDTINSTINTLEKLLTIKPASDTTGNEIAQQDALTGTLFITKEAFSGTSDEAIKIYENYAKSKEEYERIIYVSEEAFNKDTRIKFIKIGDEFISTEEYNPQNEYYLEKIVAKFPNLDISFEAETAKLYTVNIFDGDEKVYWHRKAVPNQIINTEFLKYGPKGSFKTFDLFKSPTAEFEYIFQNQWIVKDKNGIELFTIDSAEPLGVTIDQDLYLYPVFERQTRNYLVTVKIKHPQTKEVEIIHVDTYSYGTNLSAIENNFETPYADSSNLSLLEVYNFIGYSLIEDGLTAIADSFAVRGETTLWAIFDLAPNARTIVHPEWFNAVEGTYTFVTDTQFSGTKGVILSPNRVLKGKITIPAYVDDKPVIGIEGFANSNVVTHIFMEERKDSKENKLYSIGTEAFYNMSNLVFFDFDRCAVRVIGARAFQKDSKLMTTSFGKQLFYVHDHAFNQSLTSSEPVTLILPASLYLVQEHGFGVLGIAEGSSLEIGTLNELSQMSFREDIPRPFYQNTSNKFATINFYSSLYDAGNTLVESKLGEALMENGTLSII